MSVFLKEMEILSETIVTKHLLSATRTSGGVLIIQIVATASASASGSTSIFPKIMKYNAINYCH